MKTCILRAIAEPNPHNNTITKGVYIDYSVDL